jgi:hypothetical protein
MPIMVLKMMQCLKNVTVWTIMTVKMSVIIPMKILGDSMTSRNIILQCTQNILPYICL